MNIPWIFQVTTLLLLAVPGDFLAAGAWCITHVVFVLGHWLVYWHHEKEKTAPESKSEFFTPYLIATIGD